MENGGNYHFRKFMIYYKIRCKEMYKRYMHKAAQYYAMSLRCKVDGTHLPFKPPSRHYTLEESSYFISRGIDPANFFPQEDQEAEEQESAIQKPHLGFQPKIDRRKELSRASQQTPGISQFSTVSSTGTTQQVR